MSRLKEQYQNEIVDAMIKKFGYKNIMEVPKLDKIVVNMGVGEAKENAKVLEAAIKDMETITGQKAVATKAKNAIANFKIRENMPIGCKTTLRGEKMYEFMDRLVNLALPRVRDFRGVNPNAFDGRGNYALGIKEQYQNEIVDAMIKKFGYKNIMEVPKLDKIVVNMGVGEAKENAKVLEAAVKDMETITGQKAVTTKAKNSVANFKIREGMPIGCKTTLRGEKMYEFMDRLINLALPRVRDFRGVNPDAFDGRGNYALGIKEQLIFPEIEYDKVDKVRGMDVIFVTTAKTDEEARELLTLFNMPFAK